VDHWWSSTVKEQQAFEDLSTPVLENLQVYLLEPSYVPANIHIKTPTEIQHTHSFKSHFPAKCGLARCPLGSSSPVLNLCILSAQVNTDSLTKSSSDVPSA